MTCYVVLQMDHSSSLPRSEIDLLGTIIAQSGDPFPLSSTEQKEKEIIHTNRVKLTDYIHDVTMLFPYLKERHIFSVYDCDVIKGKFSIEGTSKEYPNKTLTIPVRLYKILC